MSFISSFKKSLKWESVRLFQKTSLRTLAEAALTSFVKGAFYIGILLCGLCLYLGAKFDIGTPLGSLLINLSGDFLMAGLTISVIDIIIKKSERKKFGGVPDTAKTAFNKEVWSLVGSVSYFTNEASSKTTQEIIDSGMVDDALGEDVGFIARMNLLQLAELEVIDEKKLTYEMFSEMLRMIRQTLEKFDNLIARYGMVLDSEDIAKAISIRDKMEKLGKHHVLITLTIPFFGQQKPRELLDDRERSVFMSIKDGIIDLADSVF